MRCLQPETSAIQSAALVSNFENSADAKGHSTRHGSVFRRASRLFAEKRWTGGHCKSLRWPPVRSVWVSPAQVADTGRENNP